MSLIPTNLREKVVRRAADRCEYCLIPQESQVGTFPVDHVLPSFLDGKTELDNLALACPACNASKWTTVEALDRLTGKLVPIYNPRKQAWSDHFSWLQADPAIIEPLSPCGRATVDLLDLNSARRVTIRRWLLRLELDG